MRKEVNFNTEYKTAAIDEIVYLTVLIGKGQPGSSVVKLGDNVIKDGTNIVRLPIGKNSELKGKTLKITSVVDDFQIFTNETCIDYLLTGGEESKVYHLDANVDIDGDKINYFTKIKFI
ncbi:MAG TPA: hypothetical protein PKD83_06765 [Ignavibacteria bacterium]|nr:hypothetical protein [Ignavibacteria bacterium]